jgi:hypothetical protein
MGQGIEILSDRGSDGIGICFAQPPDNTSAAPACNA